MIMIKSNNRKFKFMFNRYMYTDLFFYLTLNKYKKHQVIYLSFA
ncbi:MAG: hypothetical protein JWP12_3170 [Bacteroidetes bacterium]|nr:hypothetical protein [Bacteroidota bacterium]